MKYAVTVGKGKLLEQSMAQIRTLHTHAGVQSDEVVATCPPDEWKEIDASAKSWLGELAQIRQRDLYIDGYGPSANLSAFIEAFEVAESNEWVVLLDTDCLVLSPLQKLTETNCSVRAKPLDRSINESRVTREQLRTAFNYADVEFTESYHRSTVDNHFMPPSWNAGVVFAKSPQFVADWAKLARDLYSEFPDLFFLDQLALSPIAYEYGTDDLSEDANFPVPLRYWVPDSVSVLHYHEVPELLTILNPRIQSQLYNADIWKDLSRPTNYDLLRHLHRRTRYTTDILRWKLGRTILK